MTEIFWFLLCFLAFIFFFVFCSSTPPCRRFHQVYRRVWRDRIQGDLRLYAMFISLSLCLFLFFEFIFSCFCFVCVFCVSFSSVSFVLFFIFVFFDFFVVFLRSAWFLQFFSLSFFLPSFNRSWTVYFFSLFALFCFIYPFGFFHFLLLSYTIHLSAPWLSSDTPTRGLFGSPPLFFLPLLLFCSPHFSVLCLNASC